MLKLNDKCEHQYYWKSAMLSQGVSYAKLLLGQVRCVCMCVCVWALWGWGGRQGYSPEINHGLCIYIKCVFAHNIHDSYRQYS